MGPVRSFSCMLLGAAAFFLTACESGPAPPAKGSPAFYWAAAKENFNAGDHLKTAEQLEALTRSENEFTAKAWPWRLVILSGLVAGYMDYADQFENGMKATKASQTPFRKQMSDARSLASQMALSFAEAYDKFSKQSKDEQVPLAFTSPGGSAVPSARFNQVGSGALPPQPEIENVLKEALRRGVLLAACRAAGAPKDPAKASELLKDGTATVPRATFLRAIAESYYDQAGLFGRRKLDLGDRRTFFLTRAGELAKQLPDSKENKEFAKKIESELKAR